MTTRSDATRNIYTIPPGVGFLDSLAGAVLAGRLPGQAATQSDPLALTRTTILLPTRRAARGLQEAFLSASKQRDGQSALLLPAMRPIAEGEEDATLLAGLASHATLGTEADIAPAVSELERRLVLMQFVQRWSQALRNDSSDSKTDLQSLVAAGARTPAQAAHLAKELARLIDMIETEGVDLNQLGTLVPDTFSAHWQQTLDFLDIVVQRWPTFLDATHHLSPTDRRNRVILAEAERLAESARDKPVIVAGVTGSIPATATLMQVVAALPHGTIVLPGLDTKIADDDAHKIINDHPEHPQFGLLRLLRTLGCSPVDVQVLSDIDIADSAVNRSHLIAETLRPATTTHLWRDLLDSLTQDDACSACADMNYLAAPNAQDEAEAVALILREAAEQPGRTAALVSPDRLLARRVAIRLESWGIRVDDSAGRPFPKTVTGAFLDLVITAAAKSFCPQTPDGVVEAPPGSVQPISRGCAPRGSLAGDCSLQGTVHRRRTGWS